jgi:hydroxymethylglutaryl-CoA synthase
MATIGIDAIALAVPEGYLDLADLATARGVAPAKYVEGLGVERMAVAQAHEDPVALAATATKRLLSTAAIDPAQIGLCVVGTESAVDHSKPVAAYLHGLLGLPQQCRVFEAKHACFGGTAGLLSAVDWIASGAARGRLALVVCTDIARYQLRSAGEPTQGAGAVAMIVAPRPRLLELAPSVTGSYAQDVNDFWRPLYSKNAVVDGGYSVQCYLDALAGAYREWQRVAELDGMPRQLCRQVYHVPYGKMAKKAHRHLCQLDGRSAAQADASFATEVAPSLWLPAQVGNIYTGSLYLALASLLDAEAAQLEGQTIGLFSYGSGCGAEYFAARVAGGADGFVRKLRLAEPIRERRRYTVAEYEAIRLADEDGDRRRVDDEATRACGAAAFLGVENEVRRYRAC